MKTLSDLGIKINNTQFKGNSHLAGLAIELGYFVKSTKPDISLQLTELALSLINLRNTSLLAYGRLAHHYKEIIKEEDEDKRYILLPLLTEFAYNFIILGKSAIDISACIAEIIENRTFRQEEKLTDIAKYINSTHMNSSINMEFVSLKNKSWFKSLELIRNRIVHRGVRIEFNYLSADDLKNYAIKSLENKKNPFFEKCQKTKDYKFNPIIDAYLVKKNFSWTGVETNIDNEWVSDGKGNVKSKIDIESIAKGLAIDYYEWEKELTKSFLSQGLLPEIASYKELVCWFTNIGSTIIHPRVGAF